MRRIISRRLIAKFIAGLLRGVRDRWHLWLLLLLLLPKRHAVVTVRVAKLVEEGERRRGGGRVLVVKGRAGGRAGRCGEIEGTPGWRDHRGILQTDRVRRGPSVLRETWYTSGRLRFRADRRRDVHDTLLLLLLLLALPTLLRLRGRGRGTRRLSSPTRHGQDSLTVLRGCCLQALKQVHFQFRGPRSWATRVRQVFRLGSRWSWDREQLLLLLARATH